MHRSICYCLLHNSSPYPPPPLRVSHFKPCLCRSPSASSSLLACAHPMLCRIGPDGRRPTSTANRAATTMWHDHRESASTWHCQEPQLLSMTDSIYSHRAPQRAAVTLRGAHRPSPSKQRPISHVLSTLVALEGPCAVAWREVPPFKLTVSGEGCLLGASLRAGVSARV
jgi:hypothetical protein